MNRPQPSALMKETDPLRQRRLIGLGGVVLVALIALAAPLYAAAYTIGIMVALLIAALLAAWPLWADKSSAPAEPTLSELMAARPVTPISPRQVPKADPALAKLLQELESLRGVQHELLAAKQAAEAAMMAKGEFLATMSHEIRTPLNGVLPLIELVLASTLNADQRDHLSTAYKSAQELLRIVDDILDYSKLEANKLELENVGINLKELVNSVTHLMEHNAQLKNLKLSVVIDPGVRLAVRGDPVRLRQVLTNLVSNAIKFTQQGHVVVQLSKRGETRTHYDTLFTIKDTGVGLSAEAAGKLFQPFSQADASTTRVFGGTGLGLVICKRLVDLMGGRIGVRSELGKGSLFWFSVPLPKSIGDLQLRQDLGGLRALLLASEAALVRRVGTYFSNFGVNFLQTEVTNDALGKLRASAGLGDSWAYELIVVDSATLSGEDITTLIQTLLSDTKLDRLCILVLTDNPDTQTEFAEISRASIIDRQCHEPALRQKLNELLHITEISTQRPAATPLVQTDIMDGAIPTADLPVLEGRALLVEDNAVNRLVAQRLLSLLGLTVDWVENGREALDRLNRNQYSLVLMDCQMPVMDGYTATRAWRMHEAERKLPRLPIIAMTANAMAGDREKCLAAGMDDYLSKPLNQALLRHTLQHWLKNERNSTAASKENSKQPSAVGAKQIAPNLQPALHEIPIITEASIKRDPVTVIDQEIVRDLFDVMGSEFVSLIRIYLEDAPKNLAILEQAAVNGDISALIEPAHLLKSTSANLGALAFSELAKQIENGARSGLLKQPQQLVQQLSCEYRNVAEALHTLLERPMLA